MTTDDTFTTEEAWHTLDDGEKSYTKTWKPVSVPKARIVYLHGFSDHCNNCTPFFPLLAAQGIEVFGIDQRGWGRSVKNQKQRGLSGNTAMVMKDIDSYLRRFLPSFPKHSAQRPDDVPVFLVGHSMGGAEVIYHASTRPSSDIRGYISMAPWIRLPPDQAPSKLLVISGTLAAKIMPHFQTKQIVRAEVLSHDLEVVEAAKLDELCHDHFTLEGAASAIQRGLDIDSGKITVSSKAGVRSFLLAHGTGDLVCDHEGAKQWFDKHCNVEDKEMKSYEDWYHKSECLVLYFVSC
jgi:acylglycerol lipase